MKKAKWLAVLTALVVALCALPLAVSAQEPWASTADTTWYNGHEDDASYTLTTAKQLAGLAQLVNEGNTFAGKTVTLAAPVDLSEAQWVPIGAGERSGSSYNTSKPSFQGTFDGGNNAISGLTITGSGTYGGDMAIGLFGVVAGGTVKNVNLTDAKIACDDNELAGIVAGLLCNDGVISGCQVSGTVSVKDGGGGILGRMVVSGTVDGCVNNANVVCTAGGAGGIVGKAYYTQPDKTMTISNCTNNGFVSNVQYHAGGICAFSAANVTGCTNNGAVSAGNTAGGIVAEQVNWGTVSGNTNTKDINGGNNAGGIVGWVRYQMDTNAYAKSDKIQVLNNTNSGAILGGIGTSGLGWGGIVGTVYNAAYVSGNTNNAPSVTGGTFAAGVVGNLQENDGNLFFGNMDIDVLNNVSTTPLDNIIGDCKNEYAYNNNAAVFVESENSAAWVARISGQNYATLDYALQNAAAGATVELQNNAVLTKKLTVSGGLTILGNGHSISGNPDDKGVYIEVTGGTFNLSDVTLKDFGGNVSGASGDAVIKVPATVAANTVVNATNVNVSNFARSAYDIRSGSFAVTGGSIDCANSVGTGTENKLTKGILAGLGTNKVTGTVKNVSISNSDSNYADWNTAAIEVYNNAEVAIEGGSITGTKIGIHVDNYWARNGFNAPGDAVVTVSGTKVDATEYALRTYSDKDSASKATVAINSGSFKGKIGQVGTAAGDTIVINGGTFSEKPNDSFLAPGLVYVNGSVVKPAPKPEEPWTPTPTATPAPVAVLDSTPKTGAVSLAVLPLAALAFAGLGVAAKRRQH